MKLKIVLLSFAFCTLFSGISHANNALKVGDKAPQFVLENAVGEKTSLATLLKKGPVVLTWYRGSWCPYCNVALVELQEYLDEFKKLGTELVAISPQVVDSTLTLQERKELRFTLLSDTDNAVAQKYGLSFKLDPDRHKLYEEKLSLSKYNGNNNGTLPITATYIIDQRGVIRYAYVDEDYSKRADPKELVGFLKTMRKK